MGRIRKSFKLDSEPVLRWPKGPAKQVRLQRFKLNYRGKGMTYTLHPEKTASFQLVECNLKRGWVAWRDIFSDPQLQPTGLLALSQLHANFTATTVREWVSQNGFLGFRQLPDPVERPYHFIPCYVDGGIYYYSEPVDCIRSAAQRAANVVGLWSALKKSYATVQGRDSDRPIRSIVTIKEDIRDSYQFGRDNPVCYRVFVNGERRSQWPIPKSPRDWRRLAYALLAEYIQEHIQGEVRVSLGIQKQNRDVESEDRAEELQADWILKPTWHVRSALAAYYVELLMVVRQFRMCKTCGEDISHQRATSTYCGHKSSCRSKDWHRQQKKR